MWGENENWIEGRVPGRGNKCKVGEAVHVLWA